MAGPRSAGRLWLYPANLLTELRLASVPLLVLVIVHRAFGWALLIVLFAGVSDGLDGWLARRTRLQSRLGEYLDPIADKAMLSTLFVVLAWVGALPWLLTILVFTRDLSLVVAALCIYWTTSFHDFRPNMVGKVNTVAEIVTVALALLNSHRATLGAAAWAWSVGLERLGFAVVFVLSFASGIHYALSCSTRYHRYRSERDRQAA